MTPLPTLALGWLMLATGVAAAGGASVPARSHNAEAMRVHPDRQAHRHCGGACLRSGLLSWYCRPTQTCALDCASSPPQMHCHDP